MSFSESDYSNVPTNKDPDDLGVDEVLKGVRGARKGILAVAKLVRFQIDTPENADTCVTAVLQDPRQPGMKTFKGRGAHIGAAMRDMLNLVNVDYPLGGEYGELEAQDTIISRRTKEE